MEKLVLISHLLENDPEQEEAGQWCKFHLLIGQKLAEPSDETINIPGGRGV